MKKFLIVLLSLLMVMGLAACGEKQSEEKVYKIGICNYVDDASLNQIAQNIQDELNEYGAANNIKFDIKYDNGNADVNVINQIIANFIADDVDAMVGIATPVAMLMQSQTEGTDMPVIFSAVSDPLSAGLVDSLEKPGANITGTSDYLDTNAIMNLIFAQNPEAKTIGLLYDVSQDSSTTAIAAAKKYLDEKGVKYIEKSGVNVTEITSAANELIAANVDAVFTPSDNTVMTAELSIYELFAEAKIPHYAGADSFALNGAFCGYGVDYANLGRVTGKMVIKAVVDKESVAEMSVATFDNGIATVNTEICEQLGLDFTEIEKLFAPLCTSVKEITTKESFD